MRVRLFVAAVVLGAGALADPSVAASCDPDGPIRFICGINGPEDLIPVPQSEWVVAGGYAGGGLYAINTKDHGVSQIFPGGTSRIRHDKMTYATCPGPIDTTDKKMSAHGLNIRPGTGSVHTLYVVHHGSRESVEVFEIDTQAKPPVLTWVGCAVVPGMQGINSVSPVPGGGFVTTNFAPRGGNAVAAALKGSNSGEVWEWQPKDGWKIVPGSESPGPNGIEASRDGNWLYVNLWPVKKMMRLSRGKTPVQKDVIDLPFHPDNIRWQADGSLLSAGHAAPSVERLMECFAKICTDATSNAARVDPKAFKAQEVVRLPFSASFSGGTVALQVGQEIWLGAVRGDRVARHPIK